MNRLVEKVENLQTELVRLTAEIISEDLEILEELQKDQLYAGRDASGDFVSPSYLEDTFFKSPEAAERYAQRKDRIQARDSGMAISLFGPKPYDVPDLIITGRLVYDSVRASISNNTLAINFSGMGARINEKKYRGVLDGLSDIVWQHYREFYFLPKFLDRIEDYFKA